MITDKRKQELNILAEQCNCAGDNYYFEMDDELFGKTIKGKEDDYRNYIIQRKIGFEQFQEECINKMKEINSSEELHFIAENHNSDDGIFLLEQIISNPNCDILTAKIIYWMMQPEYYYESFGSPENCNVDYNMKTAKFIVEIEKKANKKGFKTGSNIEISEQMVELIEDSDLNFSKSPYNKIPISLRMENRN